MLRLAVHWKGGICSQLKQMILDRGSKIGTGQTVSCLKAVILKISGSVPLSAKVVDNMNHKKKLMLCALILGKLLQIAVFLSIKVRRITSAR